MGLFDKVFGSHSDKELKRISKTVDKIEALDAVSYTHLTLPTIA